MDVFYISILPCYTSFIEFSLYYYVRIKCQMDVCAPNSDPINPYCLSLSPHWGKLLLEGIASEGHAEGIMLMKDIDAMLLGI